MTKNIEKNILPIWQLKCTSLVILCVPCTAVLTKVVIFIQSEECFGLILILLTDTAAMQFLY